MQPAEARPFLTSDWHQHSHREVQKLLQTLGWTLFAQGDWAYAYESPGRHLVGRVAPFDPGYQYFIDLCARCHDNPYLPEIYLASFLEGGVDDAFKLTL